MIEHLWWYVARSAGTVTLGASTGAVVWGLLLSTRVVRGRGLPRWLLDLHRFLGGLTIGFLVLHVAALIADSTVHFGAADVAIPFHSAWRPVAVAGGVVAMYLFVAVEATSLAKRRLPRRVWSGVHLSSFVAFVLSVAHTVAAGTDVGNRVLVVLGFVTLVLVLFLVMVRVLATVSPEPRRTRQATTSSSVQTARPAKTAAPT